MMKNVIKVLSCRYQQCLEHFNMLTVQGCPEARLLRHLSNHVFPGLFFLEIHQL